MKRPFFRIAILMSAILLFSLQSCMKEYTCKCPDITGVMSPTGKMKAATKYEAERACKALGGDNCIADK